MVVSTPSAILTLIVLLDISVSELPVKLHQFLVRFASLRLTVMISITVIQLLRNVCLAFQLDLVVLFHKTVSMVIFVTTSNALHFSHCLKELSSLHFKLISRHPINIFVSQESCSMDSAAPSQSTMRTQL